MPHHSWRNGSGIVWRLLFGERSNNKHRRWERPNNK